MSRVESLCKVMENTNETSIMLAADNLLQSKSEEDNSALSALGIMGDFKRDG